MIFAIGLTLFLAGYLTWMFSIQSASADQLRRDDLGRLYVLPKWWGMVGFAVMIAGGCFVLGSILLFAARFLL